MSYFVPIVFFIHRHMSLYMSRCHTRTVTSEICGRSPPPIVSLPRGRPHSPEAPIVYPITPPRISSPELTLLTKSPHSKRIIKKGKTGDDPVPHLTPHKNTTNELPKTYGPSTDPVPSTKTTPTTNLLEVLSSARTVLEHLTVQLETVTNCQHLVTKQL